MEELEEPAHAKKCESLTGTEVVGGLVLRQGLEALLSFIAAGHARAKNGLWSQHVCTSQVDVHTRYYNYFLNFCRQINTSRTQMSSIKDLFGVIKLCVCSLCNSFQQDIKISLFH